jgi:hypothetical protein
VLLCAVLGYLFFHVPWWTHGGGWINERLVIYGLLFIFLWPERLPRIPATMILCVLLLLCLLHLERVRKDYQLTQQEIAEFADVAQLVEPHSTLSVRCPDSISSDRLGGISLNVRLFEHAASYCAMGTDVVYLDNYEAKYDYFPISWCRARTDNPDYLVLWKCDPNAVLSNTEKASYETVYQTKRLRLLKLAGRHPASGQQ